VKLLPHQKYSMLWLKWREQTVPYGSILADDMGLGKTLTVLAYLKMVKDESELNALAKLKAKHGNQHVERAIVRLRTLVILPASLLAQWQGEIKNKFQREAFKVHVYHEAERQRNCHNMEDNDLVFTTYEIVARECNTVDKAGNEIPCYSPLAKIKWRRIILGI
jgi:transcription termination factor 2